MECNEVVRNGWDKSQHGRAENGLICDVKGQENAEEQIALNGTADQCLIGYTKKQENVKEISCQNGKAENDLTGNVKGYDSKEDSFLCYRLTKSTVLIGVWFSMGMFLEIMGPTLPDLKSQLGISHEQISRALAVKSVGMFAGAILGGILHGRFYRHSDLVMSFSLLLGAVGISLVPWSKLLSLMATCLFATGVSEGIINTGGNTMVMHLWEEKAASPMLALHFGYAVGAMTVPQIVACFYPKPDIISTDSSHNSSNYTIRGSEPDHQEFNVSPQNIQTYNDTTVSILLEPISLNVTYETTTPTSDITFSYLKYSYAIVGLETLLFSFIMFGFYIKGAPKNFPTRKTTKSFRELASPASCANGNTCYGLGMMILLFVYFTQLSGCERAFGKFLFTYATTTDVEFSEASAATLNTAYWGAQLTGRALGALLAHWVALHYIIVGNSAVSIISAVILSIFGHNSSTILWIFACLLGTCISLMVPSGMGWANLHLHMNSISVMVLVIALSCGGFMYHYLPGPLFELYGEEVLMPLMTAVTILCAVLYASLEILACTKGKHVMREVQTIEVNGNSNQAPEAVEPKLDVLEDAPHTPFLQTKAYYRHKSDI